MTSRCVLFFYLAVNIFGLALPLSISPSLCQTAAFYSLPYFPCLNTTYGTVHLLTTLYRTISKLLRRPTVYVCYKC